VPDRSRRRLARAFWPIAFGLGLAAEAVGQPPLPALDAATGITLLALGAVVSLRRTPWRAVGSILAAAAMTWFAGSVAGWAVFLHRGPLAQLILTYPARRWWPSARAERIAVATAYGYALVYPIANNNVVTIAFAFALVAFAAWRYHASGRAMRRARVGALAGAGAFALVIAISAGLRLAGAPGGDALLAAYELVIILVASGLTADLLRGKWTQGLVTTLVVDLGQTGSSGTLGDQLARTLGDPTLTVGYWISDQDGYVDQRGRPRDLPDDDTDRRVTLIDQDGAPSVALIHDPAVLNDPSLLADITAATRLAIANARLQAEIRARMTEVEASRRRLVEAADEQRRQLERELRDGAGRHLTQVAEHLDAAGSQLADASATLNAAISDLHELARGIHPATLTDHGLPAAIGELAARSPVRVELTAPPAQRWPTDVEAAGYFVCAEAVTNVAKYAQASHIDIQITSEAERLQVEIADDGIGGADQRGGSGLRGLIDRVEALGGTLTIDSPPGQGTRLHAKLPLSNPSQRS
jgi:signal transduction histidine kinase